MKRTYIKWTVAIFFSFSIMLASQTSSAYHGGGHGYRGHQGPYYHQGVRYKYYRNGNYYNYHQRGNYFRYYRNGFYFNNYNGQYYGNVYYRGRMYNRCQYIPAQRIHGRMIPARRICR